LTAAEYNAACAKLGLPPQGKDIQRLLGICEQTAHRYASGKREVDGTVARLLEALVRLGTLEGLTKPKGCNP
jgi:hypothetical protein